ncbi:MAG TPA: hypothetical protein V6D12_01270 [Candidatus Obscuribacterales bacterium]
MLRFRGFSILALITALIATPVLAQSANFGKLTLSPGFRRAVGIVSGYTNGSFSLSSIANRDRQKNACIGYGDPTPDHIMVLEKDFSRLEVKVDTGGKDTTLVIKGPDDTVRCGDDTGNSKDASIEATNWKAGKYSIWVGNIESGQTWNYTLSVRE